MTTGTGEVEFTADRAILWLSYSAKDKDRTRAVSALAAQVANVEPLLDRPGVEVRSRQLSVHANWENKKRTGCHAEQSYQIRVSDAEVLEDLLGKVIASEPGSLSGPNWELSDKTEANRQAQQRAVADAKRRAEGYAEALGMELGPLVRITDGHETHGGFGGARYSMAGGSAPDVSALNLEPESITVSATCTATWSLLG